MRASPLPLRLACATAALIALLAAPASALAHRGSPASVASDYEATLTGVTPAVAGLTASVTGGDIDLVLRAPAGRTVVVLGVEGEPFLRFSGGRVYANERSPTAGSARVITLTSRRLTGVPIWRVVHRGTQFRWHEQRLRPGTEQRNGAVARIAIPLRVDGRAVTLAGRSRYADPPSRLVWILPLLAVAVAGAATFRRRERLMARAALPLGVVAVGCVVATVTGSTLYAPHSSAGAALEIGAAVLLGAAALTALALVREAQRAFAAAVTGGLCVLVAASSAPVLTHGFVLSRLPADLVRAATLAALAAGAWLCLLGAAGLYRQSRPASSPTARRRVSPTRPGL